MRGARQFAVFALFGLMLAVGLVLVLAGSVCAVALMDPEFDRVLGVAGVFCIFIGGLLAWGAVFLTRRRVRARRKAGSNDAGVVQAPPVEA